MPLPILETQTVFLNPGDVLLAEVSASGTSEFNEASIIRRDIVITIGLDQTVDSATIRSLFGGTANTSGNTATASVDNSYLCLTVQACQQSGSPANPQNGFLGVISDTIVGNELIIDSTITPTGRTGGTEMLDADYLVQLLRGAPGALQDPITQFSVGAVAAAVSMGLGTADASLELTIASTIPVPAAAWLFGSALGLLAWLRRRPAT